MGFLNNDFINTGKINNLALINTDILEPSGFNFPQTLTQNLSIYVNMDFDESTRTFSISPKNTSYEIYSKGVKFVKTAVESVVIPNLNGNHFIYFDENGILKTSQTQVFFTSGHVPVAYIYWNVVKQKWIRFCLETHGSVMSWSDHLYAHESSANNDIVTVYDISFTMERIQ